MVARPRDVARHAPQNVAEKLAGVEVFEPHVIDATALGVDRVRSESVVGAYGREPQLKKIVAFRQLVPVDEHLFGRVERIPFAAVHRVVFVRFETVIVEVWTLAVRNRALVGIDAGLDLFEDLFLKCFGVRQAGLGVGVLGFEIGDDFRIVALVQPVVRIVAHVPVRFERLGHALRDRDGWRFAHRSVAAPGCSVSVDSVTDSIFSRVKNIGKYWCVVHKSNKSL